MGWVGRWVEDFFEFEGLVLTWARMHFLLRVTRLLRLQQSPALLECKS